MTSLERIRSQVMTQASIESDEVFFDTAYLDPMINTAVSKVLSGLDIDDVSANSALEAAVVLNALIDITLSRAAAAARSYKIVSQFGETDKQQVVDNNLKLVKELRNRLDEVDSQLSMGNSDIQVSSLLRVDRYGREVPYSQAASPEAVTLAAVVANGKVELTWTATSILNFFLYVVWRSATAGIYDPMTYTDGTGTGTAAAAVSVASLVTPWTPYYRDSPESGTWYYVLELRDKNGHKAFSNEVSVSL